MGQRPVGLPQIVPPLRQRGPVLFVLDQMPRRTVGREYPRLGLRRMHRPPGAPSPPYTAQHLPRQRDVERPLLTTLRHWDVQRPTLEVEVTPPGFAQRIGTRAGEQQEEVELAANRVG